ncbi:putative protein, unknown function [Reticulomyxa filosa]|uniref:Uncharacterized protein n=1 Tax=Reticulomyxa filosa TaxID=46433 RepID=X6NLJ3_RETFI|nr:putative protein, unknown function [Reticulomyxa filosa]|eukprot:ETO26589.1 putative protein, unknown function [Reticulomyxa filosa]
MGNQSVTLFQPLKDLLTPLSHSQCVLHKHEILICGGVDKKDCYLIIHSKTNTSLSVRHCVVKLVDSNNKDRNQITLLSFGGEYKHTLVMKYVSVWGDDNNSDNDNEINKLKKSKKSSNYNEWVHFTDNHNNPTNIRIGDDYNGVRAVIGGSSNHLLFITNNPKNISVFDLSTFQFIKHDTLPTNKKISNHCFISKPENGQGILKSNEKKKRKIFMKCCYNNTFQFHKLPVCNDIALFNGYAYVYINDSILFFGGSNYPHISKLVHKYSIQENKWMTFRNALPSPLYGSVAILSEDSMYVHIIGGSNGEDVSTHMKTQVSEWLSEKEIKKGIELKVKKEEENEQQDKAKEETNDAKEEKDKQNEKEKK